MYILKFLLCFCTIFGYAVESCAQLSVIDKPSLTLTISARHVPKEAGQFIASILLVPTGMRGDNPQGSILLELAPKHLGQYLSWTVTNPVQIQQIRHHLKKGGRFRVFDAKIDPTQIMQGLPRGFASFSKVSSSGQERHVLLTPHQRIRHSEKL
ncbi:MAG: hypothetical protein AAF587_22580 [Bacteroidota bacterium]